MDNYNNKRKGGGGSKFGGGKSFGGGDRGGNRSFGGDRGGNRSFGGDRGRGGNRSDVQMHTDVCSDCNKSCEVPFKPSSDKPVFCSDCFKNKRGDSGERGERRDSKPRFDNKKSFQGGGDSQNYKAQFEALNTKLDKILKALNPDITEEVDKVFADTKYKKVEKKVDTVALKAAIEKTKTKKPDTKKTVTKKAPAGKVVAKKTPAKKAVAKKTVAKKVAPKKVVAKKKK